MTQSAINVLLLFKSAIDKLFAIGRPAPLALILRYFNFNSVTNLFYDYSLDVNVVTCLYQDLTHLLFIQYVVKPLKNYAVILTCLLYF